MRMTTASTCCYCGVGCGVLIEHDGERILDVAGDPSHPANLGKLCSKGLDPAPDRRPGARAPTLSCVWARAWPAVAPTGTARWSMRPAYSPRPSANTGRTASPSMSPASC